MLLDAEQLAAGRCRACEGGIERIASDQAVEQVQAIPGWRLTYNGTRIRRDWEAKDFMAGIDFLGKVAKLAQAEGHHPDLHLENYRHVWIELSTHAIGGLSENDFILAAKIDRLPCVLRDA